MSKGKLRKFEENATFHCLYQPDFDKVFSGKSEMCGKWGELQFGNSNPIVLELGCGYGEYTIAMARKFPDKNFIGVDIKGARIWRGAKIVNDEKIGNAAFIRSRIECIDNIFAAAEVSEIWLTFPDPQIKKGRAKKRMTSPLFLSRYSHILKENGLIHLKTDSLHLYEYTRCVLQTNGIVPCRDVDNIYSVCLDDPLLTIKTHYEQISLDFGVSIKYLSWVLPVGNDVSFKNPDFFGDMEEGTLDDDRPKPGKRGNLLKRSFKVEIDDNSGCCFGVVRAIEMAEEVMAKEGAVASLGDLVHNPREVERLKNLGLITINHDEMDKVSAKILVRAHGEPPSTFDYLKNTSHPFVDATCPVVKTLQKKVGNLWEEMKKVDGQVVIFGKKGHAEVIGLAGQASGEAIVVEQEDDLSQIDFSKPISVVSQTTQSVYSYRQICGRIRSMAESSVDIHDTICRSVSGRASKLKKFAVSYDVVIFVAGANSSNGKALFAECLSVNPRSYLVQGINEINMEWFENCHSVGICGATSTPRRQMEEVKTMLKSCLTYKN